MDIFFNLVWVSLMVSNTHSSRISLAFIGPDLINTTTLVFAGVTGWWAADWAGLSTKAAAVVGSIVALGIWGARKVDIYLIDRRKLFDDSNKSLLSVRIAELEGLVKEVRREAKESRTELTAVKRELIQSEQTIDKIRADYVRALDKLRITTDGFAEARERINVLETELSAARVRIASLERKGDS